MGRIVSRASKLPGDVIIGDYNDPDTGDNLALYDAPGPGSIVCPRCNHDRSRTTCPLRGVELAMKLCPIVGDTPGLR